MTRLRLAFMGTPAFSMPVLQALLTAGHTIVAVYSQPPRPAGRGHKVHSSPIHSFAEGAGLLVRTPKSLRSADEQQAFADLDLDAAVVVAYGLILPKAILEAPRLGCVNIHASLLPRWRGAAPIQRAILAGDTETGITIMQMDAGLDTGPMLLKETVPITVDTTAESLHDRLSTVGAKLILPALEGLAAGTLTPIVQPVEGVTYAAKLEREEGRLDWSKNAEDLARRVRALNPWPGTWFEVQGERIKVLEATPTPLPSPLPTGTVIGPDLTIACGQGALQLAKVQRPGRGPTDGASFLRGFPLNHIG